MFFKAAASIESDAEDDGGDREDKLEKLKTLAFGLFGDEAKQVEKGRKRLNASGVESNTFAKNLARFESGKKKRENIDEERRTRRSVDNNEDDVEQEDARTTEEVTFTYWKTIKRHLQTFSFLFLYTLLQNVIGINIGQVEITLWIPNPENKR